MRMDAAEKAQALSAWLAFVAMSAPTTGELLIVSTTRNTAWKELITPLRESELFRGHIVGAFGSPTVKMFGRTVRVIGASNAMAEKYLRGMTVAGALVDQTDRTRIVPVQFVFQLKCRMSAPSAYLIEAV